MELHPARLRRKEQKLSWPISRNHGQVLLRCAASVHPTTSPRPWNFFSAMALLSSAAKRSASTEDFSRNLVGPTLTTESEALISKAANHRALLAPTPCAVTGPAGREYR